jgi:lauroyl/myristoyl acyltransferase
MTTSERTRDGARLPPPAVVRYGLGAAEGLCRGLGRGRYRVADAVGMGVYLAQPDRRHRAAANHLRRDPRIDGREARRRARASFREYARTCVDFFWASGLDAEETLANATVSGLEHLREAQRKGTGAVITTTHFGNWDMGATVSAAIGIPLTTVMGRIGPDWSTSAARWLRRRQRLEVFSPDEAARGLMRALRQGRFVALLCDIPAAGPTVVVDYCGGPAVFSAVPARLAAKTGAPLIPVECRREAAGYRVIVHEPVDSRPDVPEQVVTQDVARVFEKAVDEAPVQWYPFAEVWVDGR